MSEEDLAVVEQASATAAEVTGSMMRLKLELDEKKRTANMLQTALVKQTHTFAYHQYGSILSSHSTSNDVIYVYVQYSTDDI